MTEPPRTSEPARPARWYWPPRPLACVVAVLVLVVAFLAMYPEVETQHAGLRAGQYGPWLSPVVTWDHGWPLTYSERGDVRRFSTLVLLADLVFWLVAIVLAGTAAQWWRSHRRALWKPQISDLLVLLLIAGVAFGWIADQRFQYLREHAALAEHHARHGDSNVLVTKSACLPGFLPSATRDTYHRLFDRVTVFASQGDSDLACRFRHLVALREVAPSKTFRRDLEKLPGLESLDFRSARLPYFDRTMQSTILRELPPMPNLRGVDLYATNATDADMAWLARCRRLEMIDLADSRVGDHGLLALRELPRLRWLSISGRAVTDRGCRTLAEFPALQELRLGCRNVHDEGIRELGRLKNLRVLNVAASASETTFAELREALPRCQITTRAY